MNNHKNHPINTKTLDYNPKLALTLFEPIEHMSWSMLLRSASENHPDSRYDILVANPITTLKTKGRITEIDDNQNIETSLDDPFDLIKYYVDKHLPFVTNEHDLPFIGGALGYFSYDLGRRVETLPTIAIKDIDIPDMAIGIYQWAVIVDHHTQSAVIVGEQVEKHHQWLLDQQSQYQGQTGVDKPIFKLGSEWRSNMTKASYAQKFDAVHDYLLSGDCYQINLAQRFQACYQGSEWLAYQALEHENSAPFSAYIKLDDASVLSISPERFLQVKEGKIETKPIKGTRPRSHLPDEDNAYAADLATTEKDQAENLMIVDLLRNDIGRVAKTGTVSVPHLFKIESFPAVHHLVSTVTATLDKSYSVTDLLRACFPGGSITGAPKVRAMQIIEELEPHRRSVYCGSIGYISRCGAMDTSITIRTLVAQNQQLYVWAGGGIVADSNVESEYQETLDKLSRILPILEKGNDLEPDTPNVKKECE